MNKIIITIIFLSISIIAFAQDVSGNWIGEINIQGNKLGISFNLIKVGNGYKSMMDIPKQGLSKAEAENTIFKDSMLTISFPNFKIEYKGELNNKNQIVGHLIQGSYPVPLNLIKGEIKLNRPQEPKAPFNYRSEWVTFKNTSENINLSGTLTLPKNKSKFPVVIIISGSGPQNRNGEMFGHQPYYVIADHLTKNGIGVLRFDERGVGKSGGDFETAGIDEFSSDINSAIEYLKSRKDIKYSKLGLIGHSIGGIVAPKVATENKEVDFMVLLAAPGVNGDQLMLSQKAAFERIMGINETQIAQGQDVMKGVYDLIVESNQSITVLKDLVHAYFKRKYGQAISDNQVKSLTNQITSYEIVSLLKSKPEQYLSKVDCPVLAINGSKDFQVPASENLKAIKYSIEKNGNKNLRTVELENLNHLFQECTTGALNEYSEIEQTFSPVALQLITEWITDQEN